MTAMSENALIAVVFVTYFAAAFVWPTVRIWRLTKLNPYVLPTSDDVYGFVTTAMRTLMLCLFAYIIGQLGWPDIEVGMGVLPWMVHTPVQIAGWCGLALAIVWTVVAQAQMGRSWRIGIDTSHTTALVSSGLFALSRNPIFLAMRVCLLSLVLIRPNAVTLSLWSGTGAMRHWQERRQRTMRRTRWLPIKGHREDTSGQSRCPLLSRLWRCDPGRGHSGAHFRRGVRCRFTVWRRARYRFDRNRIKATRP